MAADAFGTLMASTDPALIVVTTAAENELAGCLVGFHTQSSITPQCYCVWLSKANHTYRVGLRAAHFAVHFLAQGDLELAKRFGSVSGEDVDKFGDLELDLDEHGVPLLRSLPHRLLLERIVLLDDGSDHVCLSARVTSAHTEGSFKPLRLAQATDLDPGRDSHERVIRP
jgi:flavin reductase (DIM6/NTAB) family NADH-FMN oxidoreductase RutF